MEGLGIGLSFCGKDGVRLGADVTSSLALHNIPEGLAVALVLAPRGSSNLNSILWAVLTSLPQPLLAVVAFSFSRERWGAWEGGGGGAGGRRPAGRRGPESN